MTEKRFVGLDLAFANNGVLILDKKGNNIIYQEVLSTSKKDLDEVRLVNIRTKLNSLLQNNDIVCLEGLSFGSQGMALAQLGATHYIIRVLLHERNIDFSVVSPSTLKKFVTGKGNCKKDLMLLKVFQKWGVEFSNDNLADAYSLARFALDSYQKSSGETN